MRLNRHLGYRPLLPRLLYQNRLFTKQEERGEEKVEREVARRRADHKRSEGDVNVPFDMERRSTTRMTPGTQSGKTCKVDNGAWIWWKAWRSQSSAPLR